MNKPRSPRRRALTITGFIINRGLGRLIFISDGSLPEGFVPCGMKFWLGGIGGVG